MLRDIVEVGRNERHGPITRLISPDGLGQKLKPFIFLDYFCGNIEPGFGFAMHPHSGIATLTWQPGCDVRYRDTTGKDGVLKAGGLEWMNAGGGAWHQGQLLGKGRVVGFQLWVPLPAGIEDGESFGQYVAPEEVPRLVGRGVELRLFLGKLAMEDEAGASPIQSHQDMTYFAVRLAPGASWRFAPPPTHTVAWAFGYDGEPQIQGVPLSKDGVVRLGPSGDIELSAGPTAASIIFGSAAPHDFPLIIGPSSVHTNHESLANGLARIDQLGRALPPSL